MIVFVPETTWALYVPFDSAFVYFGYLSDFYVVSDPGDESVKKRHSFSIGRLCIPLRGSFGVGVRKPRFIGESSSCYFQYMGNQYFLKFVNCLNMKNVVKCWCSFRLPFCQTETEKIVLLWRFYEQEGYDRSAPSSGGFRSCSFSDFPVFGMNRSWGRYMCFSIRDQERLLSCVSRSCCCVLKGFDMVPVADFYRSTLEPDFVDSQRQSRFSFRLSLDSYIALCGIYRS